MTKLKLLAKTQKRKNKPTLVSLVLLIVVFLSGCTHSFVIINEEKISVEIADTPEEMALGLMHRDSLCEDCGMIFLFQDEAKHSFWMKNTLIPLDIIFINKDMIIADILPAEPCATEECDTYTPREEALYVLEINKGFSEKKGIVIGQKISFYL